MPRTPEQIRALEFAGGKQLLDYFVNGREFKHCVAHPEFANCYTYLGTKTLRIMKGLLQINLPIHIVPFLIFKLKTLRKE